MYCILVINARVHRVVDCRGIQAVGGVRSPSQRHFVHIPNQIVELLDGITYDQTADSSLIPRKADTRRRLQYLLDLRQGTLSLK